MDRDNPSNQIFRPEVIQVKKNRWLGDAILVSQIPAYWFGLGSVLIIALFLVFIIFAQFTRRVSVTGEVISIPHPVNIFAPQQGFVLNSFYSTGQYVQKGDPLFKLDVSRNTSNGNASQNTLQAIEKQLNDIEVIMQTLKENKRIHVASLNTQLEKYKIANQQAISRYVDAQSGLQEMQKIAKDYAQYLKQGLVNREQVNQLRYLYYERQSSIDNLKAQLIQQDIQINDAEKEVISKATEFEQQILQYQIQHSALERQYNDANAEHVVVIQAQQAGYIESIAVSQGQMVNAGDSLVQLSPHKKTQFSIVLWLPNSSIPYIKIGDPVNLRYQAFPYEKFGQFAGKITAISNVPASNNELLRYGSAPKNNDSAYYKVNIQPQKNSIDWKGKSLLLSSGMTTEATLFLEKRPLYQWIFSPLYGISKSVGDSDHE